jgi:Xaa-Pro dipeptidase
MNLDRRALLAAFATTPLLGASPALAASPAGELTKKAKPIDKAEREARIGKLQRLMVEAGVGAMVMESGSSLDYFTGVQWHRTERTTAAVIPAKGEAVLIVAAFEEPSVRESLRVTAEVRP